MRMKHLNGILAEIERSCKFILSQICHYLTKDSLKLMFLAWSVARTKCNVVASLARTYDESLQKTRFYHWAIIVSSLESSLFWNLKHEVQNQWLGIRFRGYGYGVRIWASGQEETRLGIVKGYGLGWVGMGLQLRLRKSRIMALLDLL